MRITRPVLLLFVLTFFPFYGSAQMASPIKPSPLLSPEPNESGQQPILLSARVIQVSGNAQVQAAPDLATLEIAIETHAESADHAAGLNGALAEKVRDALISKLADKGRLWTGGYSLSPEYTQPRNGKPTVSGYTA